MKNSKWIKQIGFTLIAALTLSVFTGCAKKDDTTANTTKAEKVTTAATESPAATAQNSKKDLKVGVCAGPYGDMFKEAIQPELEKLGYTVKIVEFSDYVQPNTALAEKEIDLNMFQHSTYLKQFSKDHNLKLSYITEIPTAAMGVFSNKFKTIDEVKSGATVAIPNDETNLARALRVLVQTGIIKLDPKVDAAKATVDNISENPKKLKFQEVSAEILPSVLDSTDLAVINGNYAIGAGLKLSDAVYNEKLADGYYNVIAVRTEDVNSQFAKDITAIVHSDAFRSVIDDKTKQYIAFGRPSGYEENK